MKEHMLEAMKRKRYQLEQHETDAHGEHKDGQGAHASDDELAPARGADKKDALLGGHPDQEGPGEDTRDPDEQNENEQADGFDHEVHSSPKNSKAMFHNPKKDTHDPVDLNADRNMAGEGGGLESKYDKMGVDEHKDVRMQSSQLAKRNAMKAEALKAGSRREVGSEMKLGEHPVDHGESVADTAPDEQLQAHGLKGARAKLDGFLSKLKKS